MKNTQSQNDRSATRSAFRTIRSGMTRVAGAAAPRAGGRRVLSARAGFMVATSVALTVVVGSAIVAKELFVRAGIGNVAMPLAAIEQVNSKVTVGDATAAGAKRWEGEDSDEAVVPVSRTEEDVLDWTLEPETQPLPTALVSEAAARQGAVKGVAVKDAAVKSGVASAAGKSSGSSDLSIRYFNGRPVRPARTITMTVTAYTPDEFCCAGSADGITASLHHVTTNGHALVAADSRVLPLGSMITVPGYDDNQIVPVLDRGGAIKGNRLDVLFPDRPTAKQWGVKKLKVTVWEYADGKGKENWRRVRDSK